MAVDELDFGAAPLEHVLTHGGTLQLPAPAARRFLDKDGIDLLERGGIAVTRHDQLRGVEFADLLELIAERLADPHRFAADLDGEMTDVLVPVDVAAGQAGGSRYAIAHGVVTKLRPALTPKIRRHLGSVHHAQQFGDAPGAFAGQAMDLADTEDRVRRRALGRLPAHLARLEQLDGNARRDASQRAAPSYDVGDALFIDAVLERNDIAAGREIGLDELGRPFGVVGLHGDEGDIHRRLLRQRCDLMQVHGFRMRNLPLLLRHPGEFETVGANGLDILVPKIDQRHVVAMQGKMPAHVAADCAGAEHYDTLTHNSSRTYTPSWRRRVGKGGLGGY